MYTLDRSCRERREADQGVSGSISPETMWTAAGCGKQWGP